MNRGLFLMIALIVAIALPLTVTGQEKKDSGSVSITGCFNKGADADHYVIKDDKTGKETVVMGDAALLSRHANNHQVTLTGTLRGHRLAAPLRAYLIDEVNGEERQQDQRRFNGSRSAIWCY